LSRNEARAVLNLNAYDGGDDYLVPLNLERPGRESESKSESKNPPSEAARSDPRIGEMAALFTRRLVRALNGERARANPKYSRIRDAFHDELGVLMGSRRAAYERLAAFIMDYEKTPDADAAGLESDETLASYFVEGVTV
jgi:hypothetical protein